LTTVIKMIPIPIKISKPGIAAIVSGETGILQWHWRIWAPPALRQSRPKSSAYRFFSALQKVNASFVSPDFQRRESDIIWKVAFRGKPVYIFLLLEFQSSVDRWMPLRFLRYIVEFYQSFLDTDDTPGDRSPSAPSR
jgi:hypothetical protein